MKRNRGGCEYGTSPEETLSEQTGLPKRIFGVEDLKSIREKEL